jgi:hypothetical protein
VATDQTAKRKPSRRGKGALYQILVDYAHFCAIAFPKSEGCRGIASARLMTKKEVFGLSARDFEPFRFKAQKSRARFGSVLAASRQVVG